MKAAPAGVPTPFLLRQVPGGIPRDAASVWSIRQGARWRYAREICVQVTLASVTDPVVGPCLSGVGVVRCLERGRIVVTA